ncbi:transcription initiation factor TFIID subunit 4 isoform X3 [Contarinia nasturtii]|uniref:transcription initiation factor TFIID subunit 4 isoform X3 n=1 Tax=Contarinia nasturtii TaxID=265458 RepID=UPI0012D48AD4|nr:transcription initiation factor TFIID subunit 4 isoform X3 [Contarinia nasturtii]
MTTKSMQYIDANQNIVANSKMPGVQVVNMRPNEPSTQNKTVSPRVVINPHMVATRPANPGITLSALQTGQPGSALLLKTENGQYRLLHVGPSTQTTQQNLPNSGVNPTIRIQTVPSVSRFTGPPLALRKTIVTQQPVKTKVSTATPIVVNSVHTTSAINTVTRSRESINTSQLPPIATVAPVSHTIQQAALTPQPQIQTQQVNAPNAVPASIVTTSATPSHANLNNTKEKCRKFLSNLLELSSREPKPVEQNVQELIQELIDANVEPDQFCDRLERLLNASPQPCLIGFLKKSLPLLRQSLCRKELTIEGIKPPPHNVAFGPYTTSNIAAQVRPVVNLPAAAVRMVPQTTRPAITKHTAPVRLRLNPVQTNVEPNGAIQAPINVPRMMNSTQIRASSGAAIIQQHPANVQIQSHPPALHPVSQNAFAPGGAQIRATNVSLARSSPATVQIRQTVMENGAHIIQHNAKMLKTTAVGNTIQQQSVTPTIKVGSTQIKPIINTSNAAQPQPIIISQPPVPKLEASEPMNKGTAKDTSANTTSSTITTPASPKMVPIKNQSGSASSKSSAANKEKERKASASFFQQSSMSSSMYGDDDINDVAAMGGVNLAEESQRILGSTELIGRQIRSCKDEVFLHLPALQARIRGIMSKHGLDEPGNEVAVLISHACQERLKNIVEKLAVIAEHRIDIIKIDPRYEITKDVRGQIKFLEELDKAEQKRHEEQEREMLMRAAKSRSKTEDPEQAKLKAKAKEMQRAEMEELRQRDANLTALQAIGPRKKPKLENDTTIAATAGGNTLGIGGATVPLRPRIKRVNLRDMIFYLEQERDTCRSTMLYKSYLK